MKRAASPTTGFKRTLKRLVPLQREATDPDPYKDRLTAVKQRFMLEQQARINSIVRYPAECLAEDKIAEAVPVLLANLEEVAVGDLAKESSFYKAIIKRHERYDHHCHHRILMDDGEVLDNPWWTRASTWSKETSAAIIKLDTESRDNAELVELTVKAYERYLNLILDVVVRVWTTAHPSISIVVPREGNQYQVHLQLEIQ